jgi:hypothetical protein
VTWLEEHLDEVIAHFAAEDGCTVEHWKDSAVYSVARTRIDFEAAWHKVEFLSDLPWVDF